MYGIMTEKQRMNKPFGMTETELLLYSPEMYAIYRNMDGEWDNIDAFRYDPVVSTGMLANDYVLAKGLAWVNYLTPESQAMLNPGDGLVVPARTYDNYDQLPPWEKRMTHEVSFKGNGNRRGESSYSREQLLMSNAQMGSKMDFVGDFNSYFDNVARQESRALGISAGNEVILPSGPRPIGTPIEAGTIALPGGTIGVGTPVTPKYRCISVSPWCVRDDVNGNKSSCATCPTGIVVVGPSGGPGTGGEGGTGTGTGTGSGTGSGSGTGTGTGSGGTGTGSGSGGTGSGSGGGEGEVESGGNLPPVGGGGGSVGGGGEEAPSEGGKEAGAPQPGTEAGKPEEECKLNYMPIVIGAVIGLIAGYLIAKQKKKDEKQFALIAAIIGALLGFAYSKHQCKPIEMLTKIGIKSKAE